MVNNGQHIWPLEHARLSSHVLHTQFPIHDLLLLVLHLVSVPHLGSLLWASTDYLELASAAAQTHGTFTPLMVEGETCCIAANMASKSFLSPNISASCCFFICKGGSTYSPHQRTARAWTCSCPCVFPSVLSGVFWSLSSWHCCACPSCGSPSP